MQTWANRSNYHKSIVDSFNDAAANQLVPVLTDDLKHWLAKLTLLYGVPVEYFVPDYRMLPVESIRFFYLDRNWLDRLVDGAISVGVLSTKEKVFNQTFFQDIYNQVDAAQLEVRSMIREKEMTQIVSTGGTLTGLLMRSQVVTDYPGIEIKAYDEAGTILDILRMDRLSNSMLICIFNGVPVNVEFIEPSEGLHFGIFQGSEGQGPNDFNIYLRGLGFDNNPPNPILYPGGKQIDNPPGSEQYVQAEGKILGGDSAGVIDIEGLVKNIESTMGGLPSPNPLLNPVTGKSLLTPAGLAIQMVKTAGRQAYKITTKGGQHPPECGTSN